MTNSLQPLGIITAAAIAAMFHPLSASADEIRVVRDIEYAHVGDTPLKLDLYVPTNAKSPPLVVWVHGGAWKGGSKNNPSVLPLTDRGYAVASVDYRLSTVAQFPAQIHDIKAAIRYLRATAKEHGIAAERIAITGGSAGGHLAALVGVTSGVKELEGAVGSHLDLSSDVQAIVVFYGASNLATILAQSTPHGLNVRVPALALLLDGPLDETKAKAIIDGFGRGVVPKPYALASLASPVSHVDSSDPPLLWFHGDQDPQMPINQAHEMMGVYKKAGLAATFEPVYGGGHGGKLFFTPSQMAQVAEFLDKALRQTPK
jgi:acetyl esterase/lipase